MLKMDNTYGNIVIDGQSIEIDKIPVEKLNDYLQTLEKNREKLIEKQNEYLSEILK